MVTFPSSSHTQNFPGYQRVCRKDSRKSDILISNVIAFLDLLVGEKVENWVEFGLRSINDIKCVIYVYMCMSLQELINQNITDSSLSIFLSQNTRSFCSPLCLLLTELRVAGQCSLFTSI